jgi:hypothetical protein
MFGVSSRTLQKLLAAMCLAEDYGFETITSSEIKSWAAPCHSFILLT